MAGAVAVDVLEALLPFFESGNEAGFIAKAIELNQSRSGAEKLWKRFTDNKGIPKDGKSGFITNIVSAVQTQENKPYFGGRSQEQSNDGDLSNIFMKDKTHLNSLEESFQKVVETAKNSIFTFYSNQTALLNQVNTKTGLTGKLSHDFRQELTDAWPALNKIGLGMEDLGAAAIQLVTQSGKFAMINKTTWEQAGIAATAYVGTLTDLVGMFPEFEKIGLGAKNAIESIEETGQGAIKLGIDSHKMTKDLAVNVGLLNSYGFKNGVKGISDMNTKALEFRGNLADITRIADKVWSPEGAINLSANLQVLGGAIGDFNDPLKLMYMATNNVEGLQDSLIKASSSLATYNREQKRFEVTGVNLRRAKEMADQFGMSMKDLTTGAVAYQERMSAMADLSGLNIDQKDKEFLTNIAQMQDGKMTIQIAQSPELVKQFNGATEVTIDKLSQVQADSILEYRKEFQKLTPDEIIRNQATSVQNIERSIDFMVAVQKVGLGKEGFQLAEIIGVKDMAKNFDDFVKKNGSESVFQMVRNYFEGDKKSLAIAKSNAQKSEPVAEKSKEEQNRNNNQNQQNNGNITRIEIKHDITSSMNSDALKSILLSDPRYLHAIKEGVVNPSSYAKIGSKGE